MAAGRPTLALHSLRVADLRASLAFYRARLGMAPLAESETRALLAFGVVASETAEALAARGTTLLELRRSEAGDGAGRLDPGGGDAYWKIGVTLADVDLARESLIADGIDVGVPRQFRDIGYLCHLADPDGFQIELLQHRFAENHQSLPRDRGCALGSPAVFGQVTLRVRDPEVSLRFYRDLIGLRLLSRQTVAPYRFTLYFLAGTEERPPVDDLDAVENREWLWQRPYTTLELQHRWGTEETSTAYRAHDGQAVGFEGIGLFSTDPAGLVARLAAAGVPVLEADDAPPPFGTLAAVVLDPDGNRVRLLGPA